MAMRASFSRARRAWNSTKPPWCFDRERREAADLFRRPRVRRGEAGERRLLNAAVVGLACAEDGDVFYMDNAPRHGELRHTVILRPSENLAAIGVRAVSDQHNLLTLSAVC